MMNKVLQQGKELYIFYMKMKDEFMKMSHTKRFIWFFFILVFIYLIVDFFSLGFLPKKPYVSDDLILFENLNYYEGQPFPDRGHLYSTAIDKKDYTEHMFGPSALTQYSYSFFVYVQGKNYSDTNSTTNLFKGQKKTIMIRGTKSSGSSPSYTYDNCRPWIYMEETKNNLHVLVTDSSSNKNQEVIIDNFPLDIWTHVAVVIDGRSMTVYMNGKIVSTVSSIGVDLAQTSNSLMFHPYSLNNPTEYGFYGGLAQFVFHRGAYTPKEVFELYTYQSKRVANWERQKIQTMQLKLKKNPDYIR